MKKYIVILAMLIANVGAYAQKNLSLIDSLYIKKADYASQTFLGKKPFGEQYLIFCMGDKIILINKVKTGFEFYKGEMNFNFKTQRQQLDRKRSFHLSNSAFLRKCFQNDICSPNRVFTASDSSKARNINADSKFIYLFIKNKRGISCQFNVPIIYEQSNNDDKGGKIPLDHKALGYLLSFIR